MERAGGGGVAGCQRCPEHGAVKAPLTSQTLHSEPILMESNVKTSATVLPSCVGGVSGHGKEEEPGNFWRQAMVWKQHRTQHPQPTSISPLPARPDQEADIGLPSIKDKTSLEQQEEEEEPGDFWRRAVVWKQNKRQPLLYEHTPAECNAVMDSNLVPIAPVAPVVPVVPVAPVAPVAPVVPVVPVVPGQWVNAEVEDRSVAGHVQWEAKELNNFWSHLPNVGVAGPLLPQEQIQETFLLDHSQERSEPEHILESIPFQLHNVRGKTSVSSRQRVLVEVKLIPKSRETCGSKIGKQMREQHQHPSKETTAVTTDQSVVAALEAESSSATSDVISLPVSSSDAVPCINSSVANQVIKSDDCLPTLDLKRLEEIKGELLLARKMRRLHKRRQARIRKRKRRQRRLLKQNLVNSEGTATVTNRKLKRSQCLLLEQNLVDTDGTATVTTDPSKVADVPCIEDRSLPDAAILDEKRNKVEMEDTTVEEGQEGEGAPEDAKAADAGGEGGGSGDGQEGDEVSSSASQAKA